MTSDLIGAATSDGAWTDDPGPDHIDRAVYTSQTIFEAERDRVFSRVWQFAGASDELTQPGDYLTVDVGPDPVLVVRDGDGGLKAFYNACTHRGPVVADGKRGNCGAAFTCPYHQWRFGLDGQLKGVPYRQAYGPDFPVDKLGLVPAHVEQCGSLVFVATRPKAPTLREFLGEAWDWVDTLSRDREVIGRVAWTYEGNWKLWHENFRDNYHPEFVHRIVRDLEAGYADSGYNQGLEPGHSMLEWPMILPHFDKYVAGMKEVSGIEVHPEHNEEWRIGFGATTEGAMDDPTPHAELPSINIAAIFPNLDLQHAVGGLTVQVLTPLATDLTRIDISFMAPIGEPAEVRQFRLDHDATTQGSWGKVSADDTDLCERAQIGLRGRGTQYSNMARGRAPGGIGETRDEYTMRSLYKTWRDYMYDGS